MSETQPNHPSDEDLRALSLGHIAEEELARVSAHLDDCPACCRRIDQLAIDDSLQARLRQNAARRDALLVTPAQRRAAVRALRHRQEAEAAAPTPAPEATLLILQTPKQVGDYDILKEVGRGGMGVVYQARHRNLHRWVALKMVLAGEFASPTQELRFRLEAELAARVQHPNIVQVHEIGTHEGRPFLSLEWLDGGNLANRLDGNPWPPDEAAHLIETLARAIHVAHSEGIVHRDLKPANILFNRDGVAKIADFGLALAVGSTTDLTHSKQIVGTPAYMAPEQALSNRRHLGPATDVHALGVILYECLSGRRPFPGETPLEIMHALVHTDPVPPRRHQPHLPWDLEAICLKCLNKDPMQRYPSAWELAEDIERYRQGATTRARPVSAATRFARWCARHPVPAGLLAALAVVVVVSFGLVTWKWREADVQRRNAERQAEAESQARKEGDRLRRELARESSLAMLRLGMNQAQEGFVPQGMHVLARALVVAEDEQLPDLERVLRLNLAHWERRLILPRTHPLQQRVILQATASPDGRWLATVEMPNNTATVWDLTREETPGLSLGEKVQQVAFSHDSEVLMVAVDAEGSASEVRLWRRLPGQQVEQGFEPWGQALRPDTAVLQLRLSPDRQTLVVLMHEKAQLWDVSSGTRRGSLLPCVTGVKGDGCLGLDDRTLLSLGPDDTVCRWDLRTGEPVGLPQRFAPSAKNKAGVTQKVNLRALSPDGRTLAVSVHNPGQTLQTSIQLWDVATGQATEPSPASRLVPRLLIFSPDGRVLAVRRGATAKVEEEIQLYDAASGQMLGVPLLHPKQVSSLAFSPDNRLLITGCEDGQVRFWETATGQTLGQALAADRPGSIALALGQRLVTVPLIGSAKLWEVPTGSTGWTSLPPPADWFVPRATAALAPDGRTIAVNPFLRTVQAWDLSTGRAVTPPLPHEQQVTSIAFDPTGKGLLTGCSDGSVRLWDVPSGARRGLEVRHLAKSSLGFRAYFSPDGQTLLTGGADEVARLWNAETRQPQADELRHKGRIQCGAFSRDGQKVATASVDGVVQIWEVKTGRSLGTLQHPAGVLVAAFTPDGAQLLTGGEDGFARLWDLETATLRQSWPHRASVYCAGFSRDGRLFFTGTGPPEGQVRLWDRATGLPLGSALGPLGVPEMVIWLEFSPDGRQLLMGGIGSTLPRVRDLPEPVSGTARQVQSRVRQRTGTNMDEGGVLLP
jgi:eukaryotic-like serine/threonine-protein kinase